MEVTGLEEALGVANLSFCIIPLDPPFFFSTMRSNRDVKKKKKDLFGYDVFSYNLPPLKNTNLNKTADVIGEYSALPR